MTTPFHPAPTFTGRCPTLPSSMTADRSFDFLAASWLEARILEARLALSVFCRHKTSVGRHCEGLLGLTRHIDGQHGMTGGWWRLVGV